MAYAQRMPGRNRTLATATVAGLHGIAIYALVTGLGVDYVETVIPVLNGRNIPIEAPPPPKAPEPKAKPTAETFIAAPRPREALPLKGPAIEEVVDFPIKALPVGPSDRIDVDPLPQPRPTVTPRLARPRNDPAGWVSTSDYPVSSLRRNEQGAVRFELAVAADGAVRGCRITASSGFAELDAATCRLVTRRARFSAATGDAGQPVDGTYAGSIRWVIPQD